MRGCRRRPQRLVEQTPLARLFTTSSEYHQLQREALIARVRALANQRGLYVIDAFRVFDQDQDGVLNCSHHLPLTPYYSQLTTCS